MHCLGATCPEELTTAFGLVRCGANYSIAMNGTDPQTLRLHLLNALPTDAIILNIYYDISVVLLVRVIGCVICAHDGVVCLPWCGVSQVFVNGTNIPDLNFKGQEPRSWTNASYVPVSPQLGQYSSVSRPHTFALHLQASQWLL